MTHGSLFAGIGGFDAGFRAAGFQVLWQVEKEPFCKAILRSRFPEAELLTDVRDCGKRNLRAVDVLTAGFPCQDLSVAGKRAGLGGARSGLFWEVVRILGELGPPWFVLENVPGLFSSNEGRDFAVVLNALDELGYGLAWRVLNSQFFGVAQRRRRVFIVGRFGKPCPAEVLFEPESGGWDFEEGGEARADIAVPLTSGSGVIGNRPGRRAEDDYNLAVALSASAGHHGHSSPRGDGSDNIIVSPTIGADIARQAGGHPGIEEYGNAILEAQIVQQAISSKWAKGSSGPAGDEHHNLTVVNCLAPVGGGPDDNDAQAGHIVIQDARGQRDKRQNGIGIQEGGPSYTLDGTSQHAVAFAENQRGEIRTSDIAAQLSTGGGKPGSGYSAVCLPAEQPGGPRNIRLHGERRGSAADENPVGRTDASSGDERSSADSDRVRDFTGLPQGLDSARYRALGNAVTVSVAEWIGKRIVALE